MMTLNDVQATLDNVQAPYGHRLCLTVEWRRGQWRADVTNIANEQVVGPTWSADGTDPVNAARKAARIALLRAPYERWPYKSGYYYFETVPADPAIARAARLAAAKMRVGPP